MSSTREYFRIDFSALNSVIDISKMLLYGNNLLSINKIGQEKAGNFTGKST